MGQLLSSLDDFSHGYKHQIDLLVSNLFDDETIQQGQFLLFFMWFSSFALSKILVLSRKCRHFFEPIENMNGTGDSNDSNEEILQYFVKELIKYINKMQKIQLIKNNYFEHPSNDNNSISLSIATSIYLSLNSYKLVNIETFQEIYQSIQNEIAHNSRNIEDILSHVLPRYGLQYEKIINNNKFVPYWCNRICIAYFKLNGIEWYNFQKFFKMPENKMKPISSDDFKRIPSSEELSGVDIADKEFAAIQLINFGNQFEFMSFFGNDFGNNGVFRVQFDAFDIEFYDIFVSQSILNQNDKAIFDNKINDLYHSFKQIISRIDSMLVERRNQIMQSNDKLYMLIKTYYLVLEKGSLFLRSENKRISKIVSAIEKDGIQKMIKNETSVSDEDIEFLVDFAVKYSVIYDISNELDNIMIL